MSFEAKYDGWCENCESKIYEGETVDYDDYSTLTHVGCVAKTERITETCTECWIIKPCECES